MISDLTRELDELLGNYLVAGTVGEFYESSRIGARVLNQRMFVACVVSRLREMLLNNIHDARHFVEEGTFLVRYPQGIRSYVSPQCALRSDNTDDYVVRKGPDGLCHAYLSRDRVHRDAQHVSIGGMTAPQYLKSLAKEGDQEVLNDCARQIDEIERKSASKHTVIITRIHAGMLGPDDHLDNNLAAVIKPFPEIIGEVFEAGRAGKCDVSSYKWMQDFQNFVLDHYTKYVWVAD